MPFDAEVIDGKGLVVYPGFIDLFTTVGQRQGRGSVGDRAGDARSTSPSRPCARPRPTTARG